MRGSAPFGSLALDCAKGDSVLAVPATGPLFVTARYGRLHTTARLRPNGLKQICRRLGRRSGIRKVHAHRFRHTLATWAIAHDAREIDVQYLLGHSSPDLVRRYSATYRSEQAALRHVAFSPGDQMIMDDAGPNGPLPNG